MESLPPLANPDQPPGLLFAGALREPVLRRQVSLAAALVLLIGIAALVRWQCFGNPVLEYDEQFYRMMGERMLHGVIPYVDLWDRKPIGLYLIFAAAARLWGETAYAYQAMAMIFAGATGWVLWRMARPLSRKAFAPYAIAILYILWLDMLEGEGGQSPVFFELPVCLAAWATLHCTRAGPQNRRLIVACGWAVSLLIGIAAQIKYTVGLEGAYFGLVLLALLYRSGMAWPHLGLTALGWGLAAAAPTLLAWGVYAYMGYGEQWLFANFISVSLRQGRHFSGMWSEFLGGALTILPLLLLARRDWRCIRTYEVERLFLLGWAVVAFLAILVMRSFEQHYWMPLVPPLVMLCLPVFERSPRLTLAVILAAALIGQAMIGYYQWLRGTRATLDHMVAAMGPLDGCIYVYDGFPALYQETHSCLLTRYAFPGHLNVSLEARALGVDPTREVKRILAQKPVVIVRDLPVWEYEDPKLLRILTAALNRDYRLVWSEPTGFDRHRLVYRRIDER